MRAKSGQIVCERQKGETTGARATVISFAKMTTYQSNTNTNHHPAAYCQVSAALNWHIPILREVSAWSILPWEPGQPKQSCSGAASQKTYPQSHLYCKMLLKKSTSHILRAPSCESHLIPALSSVDPRPNESCPGTTVTEVASWFPVLYKCEKDVLF